MKSRERVLSLLNGGALTRAARGEIWPLPSGGDAAEILAVARNIHADFCFFDHFPGAIADARMQGIATGAVVNGPWQRWLARVGWEAAMPGLGRGSENMQLGLAEATEEAERELALWAAADADMILLADDIAYAGGPYMSPVQFEKHLLPLYFRLTEMGAGLGVSTGFHSDGQMDLLLPLLHQADFRFYSLEPEGIDPLRAWELLRAPVPLFSGLPAAWLMPGGFSPEVEGRILRQWLCSGPLVVTSACGLFHAEAGAALQKIYRWLDAEETGTKTN